MLYSSHLLPTQCHIFTISFSTYYIHPIISQYDPWVHTHANVSTVPNFHKENTIHIAIIQYSTKTYRYHQNTRKSSPNLDKIFPRVILYFFPWTQNGLPWLLSIQPPRIHSHSQFLTEFHTPLFTSQYSL